MQLYGIKNSISLVNFNSLFSNIVILKEQYVLNVMSTILPQFFRAVFNNFYSDKSSMSNARQTTSAINR